MSDRDSRRYQVIVREFLPDLEERVNELMREGWTPTGGVVFMPRHTHDSMTRAPVRIERYAQAMIIPNPEPDYGVYAYDEQMQLVNVGSLT